MRAVIKIEIPSAEVEKLIGQDPMGELTEPVEVEIGGHRLRGLVGGFVCGEAGPAQVTIIAHDLRREDAAPAEARLYELRRSEVMAWRSLCLALRAAGATDTESMNHPSNCRCGPACQLFERIRSWGDLLAQLKEASRGL